MAAFAAEKYKPCVGCGGWPQYQCDEEIGGVVCGAPFCLSCGQRTNRWAELGPRAGFGPLVNDDDTISNYIDRCPAHRRERIGATLHVKGGISTP